MLNTIGAARAADTLIFELSTEHFIRAAIAGSSAKSNPSGKSNMSKSRPTQQKTTIELTADGVFQIKAAKAGKTERRKIARQIRLRAVGKRESDGGTFAQLRFRTMHGDTRTEFIEFSDLLLRIGRQIKSRLAYLGYRWPEESVSSA